MSERIIIGEKEQCGLPISAPMVPKKKFVFEAGSVRWRRQDDYFVLEQWSDFQRKWIEIPCVV